MSLKQKTIAGLFWSFIDSVAGQGIQFLVGIILARILAPKEFGLIGMITIFITISQSFIDSGFNQALIRKQDCSKVDYSTVFYFNIIVGLFFYFLLFFIAGPISRFYHEPLLKGLIRVLGLSLIINSFTIIQSVILTKRIDFKLQAKISVIASFTSGTISVYMAYKGMGVWSLVALTLIKYFINSFLLWLWNNWRPIWAFSKSSFNELFGFGSKLLISGLLNTIYNNIYYLIIGKFYSAQNLGYYTRADQFRMLPAQNLQSIIARVSYPVLSTIQDDVVQLKAAYRKIIKSTMLITFVLMIGMAAIAKPMIYVLIGSKWEPSTIYLQMLCFVGVFYPLNALNLNMLQVQGRSDLFLRLEIIKKCLAIPIIVIGVLWGIKIMIIGMIINSFIAYYLNSYWSGRFINYSMKQQVNDILPSFTLSCCMGVCVYFLGLALPLKMWMILMCQIVTGTLITIFLCKIFKIDAYNDLKNIIFTKIQSFRNGKK
jgi:teichuronic acid exporter